MKQKLFLSVALILLSITSAPAQYYNNEPIGTTYEYQMENKLLGTTTVTQTLKSIDGKVLTFEVVTKMGGNSRPVKMQNVVTFGPEMMKQSSESAIAEAKAALEQAVGNAKMDINFEGDMPYLPLVGKMGDKLPLTGSTITIKAAGMEVKTTVEITRNEITAVDEEITSPAGAFKAFKVEQDSKTTTMVMGNKQTINTKSIYWIVPNKGVVKNEVTTMGQKMTTQLVKITRP